MPTWKDSWKGKLSPTRTSSPDSTIPKVSERTSTQRKKLALLALVTFLVIAGALIGGLVGGLKHRHKKAKSGCGSAPPWEFNVTNHSNVTIGDRSFLVHIPPSYDYRKRYPVVLSYHGYSDSETGQERITGLSDPNAQINGQDIIAVYPAGAFGPGKDFFTPTRAWQGAPYSPYGVDDVAFTHNIVQEVQSNLCVDDSRLYASGKSNGGGFANILACTESTASLFAAFALVSAAIYPTADPSTQAGCRPGRNVPLINFHGLEDTTILFDGQASKDGNITYALPNINDWREQWAIRNGCQSENSNVTFPFANTSMNEWNCSTTDPAAIIRAYTVSGLGHSWPGTLGNDGGKTTFNATTEAILPFFNNHTM